MGLITLESARLRLAIDPALGAGITDFSLAGPGKYFYPIMRRASPGETNPSSLASFFMAPWCNRIAGAAFTFGGRERTLVPTTPEGMAQHGDVRRRPWTILDRSPMSAHLELDSRRCEKVNWPWAFVCRARFELSASALELDLSVTNVDAEAFPAGCGHHPYFARRLWDDRDVLEIKAPVGGRYPLSKGVATGAAVSEAVATRLREFAPVPDEHLDAVFGGFGGVAELRWPASGVTLRIKASAEMGHLVVFAPRADAAKPTPLPYVAVEPQTQVNGALNLPDQPGTGTVILAPGTTLSTRCTFEVV